MLRYPPLMRKRFAWTRVKEMPQRPRPALLLKEILRAHHKKNESLLLQLPARCWLLWKGNEGTKGLVRWRLAGLPRPELSHSGLSMLQGRTHAQASCQCERLQGQMSIEQAIIIGRLSMNASQLR